MKKILLFCTILLTMMSCTTSQKLVSIDEKTDQLTLKVGQPCEIKFITNASTGFWWQWTNSNEITVVDSVGNRFVSNAPKGVVGASSQRYWKFEAREKGTQTLHFVYARQNRDEAIKQRDVTITVK